MDENNSTLIRERYESQNYHTFIRETHRIYMIVLFLIILELLFFIIIGTILIASPKSFLLAGFFAIMSILLARLLPNNFRELRLSKELDRFGELAEGVVTDKWVSYDHSDPEETITHYFVTYQFGYQKFRQDSKNAYDRMSVGSRVNMKYLPRDRYVARLEMK